jgi:hypothetical protein
MPYSIDDLRIIFGLSSRKAVADLAKTLKLVPERGEFSQAQMTLMYELHTHLSAGRTLSEFPGIAEVKPLPREPKLVVGAIVPTTVPTTVSTNDSLNNFNNSDSSYGSPNKENPLGELIKAITQATTPKRDLLHNYHALEDAVNHQWIISSSNVRELTGSTPHGEVFIWANFEFTKIGKVGRESGWKVRNLHNT